MDVVKMWNSKGIKDDLEERRLRYAEWYWPRTVEEEARLRWAA